MGYIALSLPKVVAYFLCQQDGEDDMDLLVLPLYGMLTADQQVKVSQISRGPWASYIPVDVLVHVCW